MCWAVQEAARSGGEELMCFSMGAQGGSRGVGMREGAAMRVALNDEGGKSGWTPPAGVQCGGQRAGPCGRRRGAPERCENRNSEARRVAAAPWGCGREQPSKSQLFMSAW